MKKVIFSLAILAATTFGAFAANDNNTSGSCNANQECQAKAGKECRDKGSKQCTAKEKAFNPFEGINLTEEQKTKLADLRKNCTAGKKDGKPGEKDGKKPELSREEKHKLAAERKAKHAEARKKYLADVKNILTPEQYTQFLENSYLAKGDRKKNMGRGKGPGHRKGDGSFKGKCGGQKKEMSAKRDGKKQTRKDMKKGHDGMNA